MGRLLSILGGSFVQDIVLGLYWDDGKEKWKILFRVWGLGV